MILLRERVGIVAVLCRRSAIVAADIDG